MFEYPEQDRIRLSHWIRSTSKTLRILHALRYIRCRNERGTIIDSVLNLAHIDSSCNNSTMLEFDIYNVNQRAPLGILTVSFPDMKHMLSCCRWRNSNIQTTMRNNISSMLLLINWISKHREKRVRK